MKKNRQIEAINGEFQLPKLIIHRVQSFLTSKEAARTAILSKSWCSAWSTRPNIDLDQNDFHSDSENNAFMEFSKKTIKRYEQSNQKIESFRIVVTAFDSDRNTHEDFVNGMIKRALKIGATRLIIDQDPGVLYPIVLKNDMFEAENLVELSVRGGKIDDLGLDRKVRCSKLQSLSLDDVKVNSAMITNIASCCPLIEKLSLCSVTSFDGKVFDYLFLSDLSSKFPSLKDLTVNKCKPLEVSSSTLQRLVFVAASGQLGLSVKFNVPSIRKFIFVGRSIVPSLSFVSVSTEWESDVYFVSFNSVSTSWFCELNKFLTVLSSSKIHLSLHLQSEIDYVVGEIRGLTKPEVENLTISGDLQDLSCYAVFDGLFRICRPKVITQYLCSKDRLLCEILILCLNEKCMCGLQDLEEVNVQLFDEDVNSWSLMTLESLVDALTSAESWESFLDALVSPKVQRKIRFHLKWKTQNRTTL